MKPVTPVDEAQRLKATNDLLAVLEDKLENNPDDQDTLRQLHVVRVQAGWTQFEIVSTNGPDPRTAIPWVARLEVRYQEDGGSSPPDLWKKASEATTSDGYRTRSFNARLEPDGKWRRDVAAEINVIAIENLAHLSSVAERMGGMTVWGPKRDGIQIPRLTFKA